MIKRALKRKVNKTLAVLRKTGFYLVISLSLPQDYRECLQRLSRNVKIRKLAHWVIYLSYSSFRKVNIYLVWINYNACISRETFKPFNKVQQLGCNLTWKINVYSVTFNCFSPSCEIFTLKENYLNGYIS